MLQVGNLSMQWTISECYKRKLCMANGSCNACNRALEFLFMGGAENGFDTDHQSADKSAYCGAKY